MELTEIQLKILGAMYFTEPFDTLVEEISEPEPVIADELRELIDKRLVQVMEEQEDGSFRKTFYYDSDDMRAFRYQSTSDGVDLHQRSRSA